MIRLNLKDNRVPVLGDKLNLNLTSAVNHFVWSINGSTNLRLLKNVNTSDDQEPILDAGPVHGFQWRHFGAEYIDEKVDYSNKGIDQLEKLIQNIKQNPTDRRLVLISWNPINHLSKTPATMTHRIAQFYINNGELSCKFYHKPCSIENDVVFDIVIYSLLAHLIAHTCDLKAIELIQTAGVLSEPQSKKYQELVNEYARLASTFPIVQFKRIFVPSKPYGYEDIRLIEPAKMTCIQIDLTNSGDHEQRNRRVQQASTLEEYKYFELIGTILEKGKFKSDRTGTGTISYFGPELQFSLNDYTIPLLTTKRIFWRGVVEELLWFIKGSTDSLILKDKGIHIWDGNGSKEFLQKIGMGHREEGDLGPIYGFQWRHIGAKYLDKNANYQNQGLDQLEYIVENIKKNQNSISPRHLVLSAWNPVDIPIMALPPCHCLAEFSIHGDRISCLMYQRSADVGLGVPFNIACYSLLTHVLANLTNLRAHELVLTLGDAHIYKDHIEPLKEQLKRTPGEFPKINFRRCFDNINDIKYEDIELIGYNPKPTISMKMSV